MVHVPATSQCPLDRSGWLAILYNFAGHMIAHG